MAKTPDDDVALQTQIIDDKSTKCIPFILNHLVHHPHATKRPFMIGLNGVQGVGKTTLVRALSSTLQDQEQLSTLVLSIDDFYLRHTDQLALAAAHPDNQLLQVRGEPGTHDLALLRSVFASLCASEPVAIPQYEKSAHDGLGDRLPESQWLWVNQAGDPPVRVVIFEGWCVGFHALADAEVEAKWRAPEARTLGLHKLEDLLYINDALREYDTITDLFDAFIHIEAEDIAFVYGWRLEQEQQRRRERGTGMADEQVVKFVDTYYPAYELFSHAVQEGIFPDRKGRQLRLVVGKDRMVISTNII